jgi:thioredoxin-related protein
MRCKFLTVVSLLTVLVLASVVTAGGLPSKYDPERDPSEDLKTAIEAARTSHKHILLDVGGYWCSWCSVMEKWLKDTPDIDGYLQKNFVLLKVNFSTENRNDEFLSRFPKLPGNPHFFVLSSDGKLLHSQGTAPLEKGKSYDREKFMEFLKKWAPKKNKN